MTARRGQAMVELALCSIVFVTVLLFGIHFAEVGYLSLKVQEAGAFAVWDSTGRKVQDLETRSAADMDQILSGGTSAEKLAEDRYADFNSLSTGDAPQPIVKALTQGEPIDVECSEDPQLSQRFPPSPLVRAAGVYHARGGFQCMARARLTSLRIPDTFLEGGNGFFAERHEQPRAIWVCGVGRASGTSCQGKLSVLLNDWGMAGEARGINAECKHLACANPIYKEAVRAIFPGGGQAGANFARQIAGGAPASADEYHFSFAGEESNYQDGIGGEGPPTYNTGSPGLGLIPQPRVGPCFLGAKAPGGPVTGC